MKVTVSESKGLKTNLNVLVKKQEIDKKIDERVIELQKTVNIKGFRPGKAPVYLLKKQFAQALYGEVLEKILQDNTYQALNENKIKPASQPKIEIKSSGEDKDLEYTISVEKTPEIKKIELEKITLTDYKLKIEDYHGAIEDYSIVIDNRQDKYGIDGPPSQNAANILALTYHKRGIARNNIKKYNEAINDFKYAIKLNPSCENDVKIDLEIANKQS